VICPSCATGAEYGRLAANTVIPDGPTWLLNDRVTEVEKLRGEEKASHADCRGCECQHKEAK
jgi:hypothetical protein